MPTPPTPSADRPAAIVVGSGVSGLSSALALLEAGFAVTIVSRDAPAHTTSAVAAASWFPFLVEPAHRVAAWARDSYEWFSSLGSDTTSGVQLKRLSEYLVEEDANTIPDWASFVPDFDQHRDASLPDPFVAERCLTIPVVEMPRYLAWLESRIRGHGGKFRSATVTDLEELAEPRVVVVNCTALGARELCNDDAVFPIRGQILRVIAPEVSTVAVFDVPGEHPGYIIPRSNDCILGGSMAPHSEDLAVDEELSAQILSRCAARDPRLAGAEVQSVAVGLRPARTEVRLEVETLSNGGTVIHNYGHGGGGVTLSWGCALEVAHLANS